MSLSDDTNAQSQRQHIVPELQHFDTNTTRPHAIQSYNTLPNKHLQLKSKSATDLAQCLPYDISHEGQWIGLQHHDDLRAIDRDAKNNMNGTFQGLGSHMKKLLMVAVLAGAMLFTGTVSTAKADVFHATPVGYHHGGYGGYHGGYGPYHNGYGYGRGPVWGGGYGGWGGYGPGYGNWGAGWGGNWGGCYRPPVYRW